MKQFENLEMKIMIYLHYYFSQYIGLYFKKQDFYIIYALYYVFQSPIIVRQYTVIQ